MQHVHMFVWVAWGVFQLIYMWCNVRGGNEEMRRVYLVLCFIHCNTAVSIETGTLENWMCTVITSWGVLAEQHKHIYNTTHSHACSFEKYMYVQCTL